MSQTCFCSSSSQGKRLVLMVLSVLPQSYFFSQKARLLRDMGPSDEKATWDRDEVCCTCFISTRTRRMHIAWFFGFKKEIHMNKWIRKNPINKNNGFLKRRPPQPQPQTRRRRRRGTKLGTALRSSSPWWWHRGMDGDDGLVMWKEWEKMKCWKQKKKD